VIVSKESTYGMEMETRTYPVDPTLILRVVTPNLAPIAGGAEGGAEGEGPGLAAAGGVGAITVDPAALADFFKSLGVPQPIGSSVKYLPPLSRLVVTNTPANLETLERLLNELNVGQNQVEIETKFLEASESTLRELGFQWYLGEFNLSRVTRDGRPANQIVANPGQGSWPSSVLPSGRIEHGFDNNGSPTISGTGSVELGGNPFTPGAQTNAFTGGLRDLSIVSIGAIEALLGGAGQVVDDKIFSIGGVLTNPQFQVIVKALSQNKRTDLLSSPRVTTLLGQPASIKIVTEFIYPTRFREPQAVAAAGGVTGSAGVAVTPSTPTSFATREVGVLLTVTPVLGTDGYTINLTLNPEVSEFLGFIDYGGRIQIPASGSAQGFVEVDNKITQPIFATRSVVTNVAIWDGQTVVLGGLAREDITEINDKVPFFGDIPFVGRLFRSKGKSVGKRNLIIFVTATLIDPAGNRIHPEGAVAGAFVPGAPVAPGQ
jgi:general secretion pathway protein D